MWKRNGGSLMSALLMEVAVCGGFDSAVQNERRENG